MSRFGAGKLTALFMSAFLAFSMVAADHAEARRGGSFGSRGTRTFQAPAATRTAPNQVAPVAPPPTPNTVAPNAAVRQQPGAAQQRNGFFGNGFGGAMMRGLLIGGLFGLLLGQGFGGLAGAFGLLLQLLLIAGVVWLVIRFFRSAPAAARRPAYAGAGGIGAGSANRFERTDAAPRQSFGFPGPGAAATPSPDIRLAQSDLDTFERRLSDVQEAFGREDFASLRRHATPEMVSFLSEELAENAKRGVVNEVTDVRLLQADIAESWREGTDDYATAAMRYQSRDVTRERGSGRVVAGQADGVTETTELWTFRRQNGGEWKLSAIQEA